MFFVAVAVLLIVFDGRAPSASDANGQVVVGILESPPPEQLESLRRKYGTRASGLVRIAFKKDSGGWQAFRSDFSDAGQLKAAESRDPILSRHDELDDRLRRQAARTHRKRESLWLLKIPTAPRSLEFLDSPTQYRGHA